MKIDDITVNVNCGLQVSDSTAEAALKLVEVYLNMHPCLEAIGEKRPDGSVSYSYKPKRMGESI